LTPLSNPARTATKNFQKKKILIGHAVSISQILAERCGGAVANVAKTNLAANSVNTKLKTKKMMKTWMKTKFSSTPQLYEMSVAFAVKRLATE